jgi:mannose-1-phosphate guanylyltransferase
MFIWSIASIRKALGEHQPEMALAMSRWCEAASSPSRLKKVLAREYPEITRISVDFALMEKAKNVMMAEGEFGWDDLGSWSALARHLKLDDHQNAIMGSCVHVDSHGNILFDARSPRRRAPVALVGVSQMIAVFTDDVCLIADQNKDQQIKELVQSLRQDQSLRHLL